MPHASPLRRWRVMPVIAMLVLSCSQAVTAQSKSGDQKKDRHTPSAAEQAQAKHERQVMEARRKEFEKRTATTHAQIDSSGSTAHPKPVLLGINLKIQIVVCEAEGLAVQTTGRRNTKNQQT